MALLAAVSGRSPWSASDSPVIAGGPRGVTDGLEPGGTAQWPPTRHPALAGREPDEGTLAGVALLRTTPGTTARRPVSRRGGHDHLPDLARGLAALCVVAAAACVLLASTRPLLAVPLGAVVVARAVLRRGVWVEGTAVVVRTALRTRTRDLATAREVALRPGGGLDRTRVLLVVDDLAVPVWRTRRPRGVDPYAGDVLADALTGHDEVRARLREHACAVRTGVRPTPLDRLVSD